MVSPEELTDPYLRSLARVPPAGPGVCIVCHSAAIPNRDVCSSCRQNQNGLISPSELIVPISLTDKSGQLYYALRAYKGTYASEETRQRFTLDIAALYVRFLTQHGSCIEGRLGGAWGMVTVVPSSSGRRPPPHPLVAVLGKSRSLRSLYRDVLELGNIPLNHNQASDRGFRLGDGADVRNERVLLLDDTFTSGARAQSAASRLLLEGAAGVAIVPIGRVVDPTYSPDSHAVWEASRRRGFDFEKCCLCDSPQWDLDEEATEA